MVIMGKKVLIVEDQFIEAKDLGILLEKANYTISFVAKSVDQALHYLAHESVDIHIAILDIFLKGELTGIDLALSLNKLNIPFIYLSENANPSVLEAAKETNPYGFVIKPFRTKDLLTAMEIASYRHNQEKEIVEKKEKWFADLLIHRLNESPNPEKKMLQVIKAISHSISFDVVVCLPHLRNESRNPILSYQKTGADSFSYMDGLALIQEARLRDRDLNDFVAHSSKKFLPQIETGDDFIDESYRTKLGAGIKEVFGVHACLDFPLQINGEKFLLSFYSILSEGFQPEDLEKIIPLRSLLCSVIEHIFSKKGSIIPGATVPGVDEGIEPEFPGIIGKSPQLMAALKRIHQVAEVDTTVLIMGETGVGKEGLVKALHSLSAKRNKPLVKINCAAIPKDLLESELFGHERGAFTDARERKIGKFEQATGGTVFLDEIGEMPLALQSKLLRVLQEKEFERVGGRTTIKADVRFVAASNKNLHKEVSLGNFRMDLYYRLNVFPITLAPLRERLEDIPPLIQYFLEKQVNLTGRNITGFSPAVLEKMLNYPWPGNIRELQHVIERMVLIAETSVISEFEIPEEYESEVGAAPALSIVPTNGVFDRDLIINALRQTHGKVSGRGGAAELLNLPAPVLTYQLKKMGIAWKFLLE
jgi:DNA-binding NtrC family response regulator